MVHNAVVVGSKRALKSFRLKTFAAARLLLPPQPDSEAVYCGAQHVQKFFTVPYTAPFISSVEEEWNLPRKTCVPIEMEEERPSGHS